MAHGLFRTVELVLTGIQQVRFYQHESPDLLQCPRNAVNFPGFSIEPTLFEHEYDLGAEKSSLTSRRLRTGIRVVGASTGEDVFCYLLFRDV